MGYFQVDRTSSDWNFGQKQVEEGSTNSDQDNCAIYTPPSPNHAYGKLLIVKTLDL